MYISRLEDIRRREVLLLRRKSNIGRRGDGKIAALVFIQKSAED